MAKKYYLSLTGAVMHDADSFKEFKVRHPIYAAALQFGYKSKFGPLMANVHWNSFHNKFGVYLSAGYDF